MQSKTPNVRRTSASGAAAVTAPRRPADRRKPEWARGSGRSSGRPGRRVELRQSSDRGRRPNLLEQHVDGLVAHVEEFCFVFGFRYVRADDFSSHYVYKLYIQVEHAPDLVDAADDDNVGS